MLTIKYQTAFKKDFEDKACSQFLLQIILDKNGLNVQKHETTPMWSTYVKYYLVIFLVR